MKLPEFKIESVGHQAEVIQFLDDRIYEFNSLATNRNDGTLFTKVIHDENRNIIAGISGWTWASTCEITLFWVKEDYRKNGYGRALLNAIETEAKMKKCKIIFLRTYSFQAPHFYQKHGYNVEHEIKDFPYGHSTFCLIKRLDQ